MAGLVGKFLQGVADVAAPAALTEQRARIQTKRDKALEGYERKAASEQRDFLAGQNKLTRQASAAQHTETLALQGKRDVATQQYRTQTLEQQGERDAATEAYRTKQLDFRASEIGMQFAENMKRADNDKERIRLLGEQFSMTKDAADQALKLGKLNLDNLQDRKDLIDKLSKETDTKKRAAMVDALSWLLPQEYDLIQDEFGMGGVAIYRNGILMSVTDPFNTTKDGDVVDELGLLKGERK